MNYKYYAAEVEASADLSRFDFTSAGRYGPIKKRIVFSPTNLADTYRLAFGDLMADGVTVDDKVVTNNGDRDKILATLVAAMYLYTNRYPERWIYFQGSTKSRTRLYRIAIALHHRELASDFEIYGLLDNDVLCPFVKGAPFLAFLIKKK